MKIYRATSGPFAERPYFTPEEIDQICADELRKMGLFPQGPEPIRVERFIEKKFKINPKYEELPAEILGYTKFGPKGLQEMVISRTLTEENSEAAERRVNSTLAHESGHGLLHAHLFVLAKPSKTLFEQGFDIKEQKILCRKEAVDGVSECPRSNSSNRWWEIQANMAIGGLLLPRELVLKALGPYLVERGRLGARTLDFTRKKSATRHLAEVFDVNPIVARIRINGLFPLSYEHQLSF